MKMEMVGVGVVRWAYLSNLYKARYKAIPDD